MASKERGILFTGDMVRVILDGRKTQTRRVIKPQPPKDALLIEYHNGTYLCEELRQKVSWFVNEGGQTWPCNREDAIKCPWQVGDRLYVREGWRCTGGGSLRNIIYRAEGDTAMSFCGIDDGRTGILNVPEPYWSEWDRLVYKTTRSCEWRSPVHMPKWAARLWLEITNIRVERVQDISATDQIAEGVRGIERFAEGPCVNGKPVKRFAILWDSINAKRGYGWDKNPWVWVIEFRKVEDGK